MSQKDDEIVRLRWRCRMLEQQLQLADKALLAADAAVGASEKLLRSYRREVELLQLTVDQLLPAFNEKIIEGDLEDLGFEI